MELIERIARARRAGFGVGTTMAVIIGFAVFVLGAPPWILVPVSMAGATVFAELRGRAMRGVGHDR